MLDVLSRALFNGLASSPGLKRLASRYALHGSTGIARRFIAGETVDAAIAAARGLESRGFAHTLNHLGESVASPDEADTATREYLDVIDRISASAIGRNISVKLTQLGLDVGPQPCFDNLRRVLDAAGRQACFVRIDMEGSAYTGVTLELFERAWSEGYRHAGVVLQSYLRRSEDDLRRIIALGARVRLVKGAYKEPARLAYQSRRDVNAAYLRMMRALLADGTYPAIATHDERLIAAAKAAAAGSGLGRDGFEFQLLLGVRRDLQRSLVQEGYRVRIYIPFGTDWFPYFMRRLGERPANVLFVVRSLFNER